jgi:hypothetical protein
VDLVDLVRDLTELVGPRSRRTPTRSVFASAASRPEGSCGSIQPQPVPLGHAAVVVTETGQVDGIFAAPTGHVLTRTQVDDLRLGKSWGSYLRHRRR